MFVRKMLARALPLTALGLVAWCPAYAVEEPVKADDVYVTATRVEKELQDVPMSVSVMTSEDIKRSPARTIGELLQDVPGVEIRNSGGQGFKRISIRGENPNRVLILIDGQKLVENKSMDGTPLLIDPSNVERVEVIKGPASVLYGSEAIGGVVNIITKKGGDKPIQGEASVAYNGASNGFAESLSAFGGMNGFKYRVSGSYSDQGNLRTPDGEAPNTSFRQKEGSAFLSYDFSDKFTVGGGLDSFKGSIHSGSMEPGYENFAVDVPKWQRDKVYAFAEAKNVTPWLPRVRFDAFWQKNEKEMTNDVNTDPAITKMPLVVTNNADNRNKQLGSSLQMDWAIGGICGPMVELLKKGKVGKVIDVQDFDLDAVNSINQTPNHFEMSASQYANPANKGAFVNKLDFVILASLEVDVNFNCNVVVGSDGMITGAQGGHPDTAAGAKCTIVIAPLLQGRIPAICTNVTTVTTPGESVDVVITDYGIAINPRRQDLIECMKDVDLPFCTIEELRDKAYAMVGTPDPVQFDDRVVGVIEARDGTIIDVVRKIKDYEFTTDVE